MKDLISIIVPFFNSESTIETCIKSILKQTINNYEIILIDNNSDDSSTKIATSYSKKIGFISYYNIKEKNVSMARNLGIAKAKGNIICFIDSDDIVHKNYLEILYKNLKHNDISICSYTTNLNFLNARIKNTQNLNQKEMFGSILNHKKIRGYVWNKMFKKDIIINNNIIFNANLKIGEDINFLFNYIKYSKNFVFIDANLYYYRNTKNNTVNNVNNYKYALDSWKTLFKEYREYHNNTKDMDLINYFYLKKYYELKYYDKKIKKSNDVYFSNKIKLNYKIKLFIYKNLTSIVILTKKVKKKL